MRTLISILFAAMLPMLAAAQTAEEKINSIIKGKHAKVGVAWIVDDKEHTVNNAECYPLMSVFKLHGAIAVLRQMERRGTPTDTMVRVSASQVTKNTYTPMLERYPESGFTIRFDSLLHYSVAESDNNACDILIEYAGGISEVDRLAKRLGVENLSLSETEKSMHADMSKCYGNWGAPSSVVELMQLAYGGNLLTKEHRGFLENIMKETSTGADKIKAGLPENVVLGHKTGSSDRTGNGVKIADNDAGVIYLPGGRKCFLAIFVKDSKESDETNARIISDIAKVIYNALSN